jgi:hypothetical protein
MTGLAVCLLLLLLLLLLQVGGHTDQLPDAPLRRLPAAPRSFQSSK